MPHQPAASGTRPASPLFTLALAAAVLYLARAVLIPLALAVLLAFLLAPLVRSMERSGLGHRTAVFCSLGLSVTVIFGLFGVMLTQVFNLLSALPEHRDIIQSKVKLLAAASKWSRVIEISRAFSIDAGADASEGIPVRIVDTPSGPVEIAQLVLGPLLEPLAITGIVVIFVAFMLLSWDDLRDRLLRLSGQSRLNVTTQALEEASRRVSRYLQTQLLINAITGLAVGVGTWLVGLPYAPLWGLLAMTLRFIPYIGPWVAAGMPLLTAFATTEGFTTVLLTLAVLVVIELVSNNLLEPWLYGTRTGLSPLGVLVSFVVWGWLWGGVGLLLATPLTVCLSVAGRYIPQLEIFNVLLSDQRALPIAARIYHRLLALDTDEASSIVDKARQEHESLAGFYDDVLVPAMSLAERDRHNDALPQERQKAIYDALQGFVEESSPEPEEQDEGARPLVLILAADDNADFLSGVMLQHVLAESGVVASVADHEVSSSAVISRVAVDKPKVIVIAALPPLATVPARRLCQKLHALFPQIPILVGGWQAGALAEGNVSRLVNAGASAVATTLADMRSQIVERLPAQES